MRISKHHRPVSLYGVSAQAKRALQPLLARAAVHSSFRGVSFRLSHNLIPSVSWQSYENLLRGFVDQRFPHTYHDGTLEIMSPSEEHDWIKRLIGRLIETTSLECGIPIKSVGSTTRRHKNLRLGLEPDESYFIEQEPLVRGRKGTASSKSRYPDLVVEVDLRRPALDRLDAYRKMNVREIWRYRRGKVEFLILSADQIYQKATHSYAFPLVSSSHVAAVISRRNEIDETSLVRQYLDWLRRQTKSK